MIDVLILRFRRAIYGRYILPLSLHITRAMESSRLLLIHFHPPAFSLFQSPHPPQNVTLPFYCEKKISWPSVCECVCVTHVMAIKPTIGRNAISYGSWNRRFMRKSTFELASRCLHRHKFTCRIFRRIDVTWHHRLRESCPSLPSFIDIPSFFFLFGIHIFVHKNHTQSYNSRLSQKRTHTIQLFF